MTDDEMNRGVEDRKLDVDVARTALGFRWVQWNERTAGAKAAEYGNGRFLASPDHVASAQHFPATPAAPLASGWDRFLPAFSKEIEPALEAAEHVGLFRREVTLLHREYGHWVLRGDGPDGSVIAVEGETLPEALCHAVLQADPGGERADG